MLNSGYYAVTRDAVLNIGPKRQWLRKHDWLVTDGQHIGVFDKDFSLDWVPIESASGQPLVLTEELRSQIEAAASPTSFGQLERRLRQQLDTEDGAPIPDMPKPTMSALGQYLKTNRTLNAAYTYQR